MTDYISNLKEYFIEKKSHHKFRQPAIYPGELAPGFTGLSHMRRATERLKWMLANEQPVVLKNEKIVMLRTVPVIPEIFTEAEFECIRQKHYIHEKGKVCNVTPDYQSGLATGFDEKRALIAERIAYFKHVHDESAIEYLECTLEILDSIQEFCEGYRQEAIRVGNMDAAKVLARVPRHKPETFHEALQYFRILHYCLWCSFNYHNTIGRFDRYMYPYFIKDMERGILTEDSALELIEEFFLSFNKDSDLYFGMQQGDNGQSMVLGGLDIHGNDTYNLLSALCLKASKELRLIDPKINLRVSSTTPLSRYEEGSHLTRQGLGFPQYSNDDVMIKALKNWGYTPEDACNYTVAACWEIIVPGKGMDIPNIGALSFVQVIIQALKQLNRCDTFDDFMEVIKAEILRQTGLICGGFNSLYMEPAPMLSLLMDGCILSGRDISLGGVYNNYGVHGTGLSTAADSLAAIKRYVYDDKAVDKNTLLNALAQDFEGYDGLWYMLRHNAPKMGNDDDYVDGIAYQLLDWFADALDGKKNQRGGIFRPGTGSAMYYVWHAEDAGATPDGRKKGESIACNYSPSIFSKCEGPFSILRSFSKPDLYRVANGGPLTIELHDTLFRNDESVQKVAMFVKSYIDMGGHQIQINAVNRDKLIDAQKHPGKYGRSLIVRVWGWSGYFVELDEIYQNHIIKRMELMI